MGESRVSMPSSANVLAAGSMGEKAWVWSEEDVDDIEMVDRAFLVVKNEQEISEKLVIDFIGVAVMQNGEVWLVFEIL